MRNQIYFIKRREVMKELHKNLQEKKYTVQKPAEHKDNIVDNSSAYDAIGGLIFVLIFLMFFVYILNSFVEADTIRQKYETEIQNQIDKVFVN